MQSTMMRGVMRLGWGALLLLLLLDGRGHAQTATAPLWFVVAAEGDTVSSPVAEAGGNAFAGMTFRYGAPQGATPSVAGYTPCATAGGCWNAVTAISVASFVVTNGGPLGADPIVGTAKELDVLETAAPQTLTVNGKPVTVPALTAPIGVPGSVHQVVLSNFYDAGGSTQALLLWVTATNQPANGASDTWSGTQFQMTVDGTIMTCLYGQSYTPGVFTLTCTTQALAAGNRRTIPTPDDADG